MLPIPWRAASSSARVSASPDELERLRGRCAELEERLSWSDAELKHRSELLYEVQRHYSSEHFRLQESLRNLNTERLRNSGVTAEQSIVLQRAASLQGRIAELKLRLRRHEFVDDQYFDDAPLIRDDSKDATR